MAVPVARIARGCYRPSCVPSAKGQAWSGFLALSFAVIGIASATPLFFALTNEYLSVGAAARGLALISRLGNLGRAVSPSVNVLILKSTGNNIYSIYFVMALYLPSGTLLLLAIRSASTKGISAAAPVH